MQILYKYIKKSLVLSLLMVFTVLSQNNYQNTVYSHNFLNEVCSDLVVGDSSYYTFSAPFMYSEDGLNLGDLILIREFGFNHQLLRSDSLERPGCTVYSNFADNVLPTADGGFVLAWSSCGGNLFKFNADLSLEWQCSYPQTTAMLSVLQRPGGYLLIGLSDLEGYPDIWWAEVDSLGQIEAEWVYGDAEVSEWPYWIEPALDGGYLLSGRRYEGLSVNPALWKTDDNGNVLWEKQYVEEGINGNGLARRLNDSSYVFAYTKQIEGGTEIAPNNLLHIVVLDTEGEIVEELANSEFEDTKYILDIEVRGEDIYVLFGQMTLITPDFGVQESRLLKYSLGEGVIWERFYHRDYIASNNSFSLFDLEFLENGQDEVELLMAGFAHDESLIGSFLQCTWVLGVDCEGYAQPPQMEISSELISSSNTASYLFENTGTQLDSLSWWFSNGQQSQQLSPQIEFDENGLYQIELTAPYCGQSLYIDDEIEVQGLYIEELQKAKAQLLRTTDLLGREVPANYKGAVLELYDNGKVYKRIRR